jgi:hypothetical protein
MKRKHAHGLAIGFTITLAILCTAGCGNLRSLTEPPVGLTGPYTFNLTASLSNSSGSPTIDDAQILIDDNVEADSCPQDDLVPQTDGDGNVTSYVCEAPSTSAASLSAAGHIGPGGHRLLFFISQQETNYTPTPYTVAAFTITVNDASGRLLKTISLPAESGNLAVGQSLVYMFTI